MNEENLNEELDVVGAEEEQEVKEKPARISPTTETRNLIDIMNKTGNIYKSLAIVSKRSRQVNSKIKEELISKLNEFASTTDNLEEVFENREQIEISKYYEKMPNPVLLALNEFMEDKTYHRMKEQEQQQLNLDDVEIEETPPVVKETPIAEVAAAAEESKAEEPKAEEAKKNSLN